MSSRFSPLPASVDARRFVDAASTPHAIIDIGSNSIRLVVWQDGGRTPAVMFNEKLMAGLGRGLAEYGRLDDAAMDAAEQALARFAMLAANMGAINVRAVATAAVRLASNGRAFVDRIKANIDLGIEVLGGDEEAAASASGVIAAIPGADGIVGDLGGGSLELVRVADGRVHERISLPFGSLGVGRIRAKGPHALERVLTKALKHESWIAKGRSKPFYAVGGSWRALAQVHMHLVDHPLPTVHQYELPRLALQPLVRSLAQMSAKRLKMVPNLSASRIQMLPGAAALLSATVGKLGSSRVVASAWGLREGLLYQQLPSAVQALDPLIEACREEGDREGRFVGQGEILNRWIAPVFDDDPPMMARIRHAACLLADVAWRAHPDFRPERGLEFALHGNWVGIDAYGRALMGSALFANFGGPADHASHDFLGRLADPDALHRARCWGLAMRFGLRLSGGPADQLQDIALRRDGRQLVLGLPACKKSLYGDAVIRRHKGLAAALGLEPLLKVK